MKALSVWKYYLNNKKKFLSVFSCVFLTVFLLYLMHMMLSSMTYGINATWITPYETFSLVNPVSSERLIEDKTIDEIKRNKAVDRTLPVIMQRTFITNTFGGNSDTTILTLKENDINYMLDKLNLKLVEGKLPSKNANEITLHYRVALNKELKVGDKIGSDVDKDERLVGEYTIVGIVDGPSMTSFMSLERYLTEHSMAEKDLYKTGMVVLPKSGSLEELNNYLNEIPSFDAKIISLKTQTKDVEELMESIDTTLLTIEIVLGIVLVLTISLVTYIYLYQRRNEYSLLKVIGISRGQIIKKALLEVSIMNIVGFVFGIVLALITGLLLNNFVYNSMGQPLNVWSINYFLRTGIIPFSVIIFSFIPVVKMLRNLDSISIIEGQV